MKEENIMLHSIQQRYGQRLRATDGEIGRVRDFFFDDKNWTVRYVVADTGPWLAGRQVLISPQALGRLYPNAKVLLVNLTRQQIEESPSTDDHPPVSRQHEEEFHRHYGYPYYAESWPLWGLAQYPVVIPPPPPSIAAKQGRVDSRLRSARVVQGYNVEASDRAIGEVADFLIDGKTWVLREIVVASGPWRSGEIHLSTGKVSRISYNESSVYVNWTKAAIVEAAKVLA